MEYHSHVHQGKHLHEEGLEQGMKYSERDS